MEQINLNLIPNGVNPVAHCKQYDVGRTFRCNLFEGNAVYTLDGTETVEVEVHKPDGNLVTLALTNTGSTYVDVTTTLQMCACSGESLAAIKITSGGVEIGSLNFVLYCERSPLEGGVTSDSGIYNLETQVSSLVASEVANQYDSANVIFDSEPTAGHGNGYAVTSEGIVDYVNPEETIENVSIASFDNGGDGVPVKELIVGIEPVQASGTPTPSSPLPITGWTDANITEASGNLWDETWEVGAINIANGQNVSTSTTIRTTGYIPVKPNTTYYRKAPNNILIFQYDINKTYITYKGWGTGNVTLDDGCYFIRFYVHTDYGTTYNNNISINYPSTDTQYHAYNGTTDTISLGQTVYGGELNVTTGELTITMGNIASYNGESINEPWLSSYDEYVPGTTPTTGAQVVYTLSTPTTTTLTPTEVATVLGYNNIYADTGDVVSVTYYKYNMMGGFNLIKSQMGTLSQLTTTDKDSIVEAINEVDGDVGDLSTLTTTAQSSVVNAINELDSGKVTNVAFDSSTMFSDISTAVKNAFNLSECYCYVLKNENVCTVTLRFKCSSTITSGSYTITGLPTCNTDIASSLASLDNKGGYMQISGTVLYIRCAASSSQYLAGSVTYPTYL